MTFDQREYQKAWYAANRERQLQRMRAWRLANLERERARGRAYREANLQRRRDQVAQRRAAAFGIHVIEDLDRDAIIARDSGICHICLLRVEAPDIQLDHVIPISRGGIHSEKNVAVAHEACNRRKFNRLLSEVSLEELGVC